MPITRVIGAILIVIGVAAVIYGGFMYSPEVAEISIGTFEMTLQEADQMNTPLGAGIIAIIGGLVLLLVPGPGAQRA